MTASGVDMDRMMRPITMDQFAGLLRKSRAIPAVTVTIDGVEMDCVITSIERTIEARRGAWTGDLSVRFTIEETP